MGTYRSHWSFAEMRQAQQVWRRWSRRETSWSLEIGLVSKVDVFLDADTAAEHQAIYISHLLYPCVSSCSDDIVEPVEHVAKCQPWP
jgi:hypothetical protein